jgi:hypothetical protein
MGSRRVVLYAEGRGETGPAYFGDGCLSEGQLGPAHHLLRRMIVELESIPAAAVQFHKPLRTGRGRIPEGSDFDLPRVLEQLLTWPRRELTPDLVVLMRDDDGKNRRKWLTTTCDKLSPVAVRPVLAVAIQEFEAWLIADINAVNTVLSSKHTTTSSPESMQCGQAKQQLMQWLRNAKGNEGELRSRIAQTLSIDEVRKRCNAFSQFSDDLRQALANVS